jgi:hypothetical protein
MSQRSIRRHHMDRIKARMKRIVRTWFQSGHLADDPEFVGKMAEVHGRPCSCEGCRSHKDVPPPRERGKEIEHPV